MQLEAEEPPHGALSPPGDALEGLVDMDALVPAYPERRAVHEADARTLAQKHFLYEKGQGNGNLLFQLHEAVVRHKTGEERTEVTAYMLHIEMPELWKRIIMSITSDLERELAR